MSDPRHVADTQGWHSFKKKHSWHSGKLRQQNKQEHGYTANTQWTPSTALQTRKRRLQDQHGYGHGWLKIDPPLICRKVKCVFRVNTAVHTVLIQMWTQNMFLCPHGIAVESYISCFTSHCTQEHTSVEEEPMTNTDTWK